MSPVVPRRSCLYMPGANARALAKAETLPADVLILDLEDAVAPESKAEAREQVCAFVREVRGGSREVVVRINDLSTPWGDDDLKAALEAGPAAVLVPKVSQAVDVLAVDRVVSAGGSDRVPQIWAMIETPAGILNCPEIAALGAESQLSTLVAGSNDLAKELRLRGDQARTGLSFALSTIVTAARAHGLAAIDGVFNGIGDDEGLEAECVQGRCFGFEGKSLIHPSQIEAANRIFAPTDAELERARAIIEAFAQLENAAKGVLKVNGEMVERLHLEEARRLVAFQEATLALRAKA